MLHPRSHCHRRRRRRRRRRHRHHPHPAPNQGIMAARFLFGMTVMGKGEVDEWGSISRRQSREWVLLGLGLGGMVVYCGYVENERVLDGGKKERKKERAM